MKRERQEMGWGKGELLTSLTFSLVGSFHLFLLGSPFLKSACSGQEC